MMDDQVIAAAGNIESISFSRWSNEPEENKRKITIDFPNAEIVVRTSLTGTTMVNEQHLEYDQDKMISDTGVTDYKDGSYPDVGKARDHFICKYKVKYRDGSKSEGILCNRCMQNPLERVLDWIQQYDGRVDMSWFTGEGMKPSTENVAEIT